LGRAFAYAYTVSGDHYRYMPFATTLSALRRTSPAWTLRLRIGAIPAKLRSVVNSAPPAILV